MIDLGTGFPLVLVPGVQGRWQWQQAAVEALARRGRTITYSLCGEPDSGCRLPPRARFDAHIDQLDRVLDQARVDRVGLCGVSYGGWIALRYAARRPERVSSLVLVSAPGPDFLPDARQQRYMRAPLLFLPLFALSSRARLRPEILAAIPDSHTRWLVTRRQLTIMARYPISPALMARRARLGLATSFAGDARSVVAPTLLITGERTLDRVIPVSSTLEYLRLIPGATALELPRTGHIGLVTQPDRWAEAVRRFVDAQVGGAPTQAADAPGVVRG